MASTSFRRQKEANNVSSQRPRDVSDDNDSPDMLDSTSESPSTPPNPVYRRSTVAKTDRDERYTKNNVSKSPKKKTMKDSEDDDDDEDTPPGGSSYQRANNDNAAVQPISKRQSRPGPPADERPSKNTRHRGADGNRHDPGEGRVPGRIMADGDDGEDDDEDDDDDGLMHYWSEARPTEYDDDDDAADTRNGEATMQPDGLTFYGKPVFGSATDFDMWKSRTDHGGGMPYRNGAADPWLSSLRRPVNYTEIGRHDAKQQRLRRKWEERVAWKSYTELQNEKNGVVMPGTARAGPGATNELINTNGMNGSPPCAAGHIDCDCVYGRSPIARPQGPSPDKMATCRDCHGGQYCTQAKAGGLPLDPKYFRLPAQSAFLPPISETTTSQSVPLTISATPGGDTQKLSIDINLKLVTPRQQNYQTPRQQDDGVTLQKTARAQKAHTALTSSRKESHRCTAECTGKSRGHGADAYSGARQPSMSCRNIGPCGQQHCQTCKNDHVTQHVLTDLARPMVNWPPTQWAVPPLGLENDSTARTQHPQQQQQQPAQLSPKTHRHVKFGRHGEYQVFCVDDYKKMKREMKLAGMFGADKDPETLQEKKEKVAIQKGYGKLVNDRNQMELALLKSKRIQAAMMAGDAA